MQFRQHTQMAHKHIVNAQNTQIGWAKQQQHIQLQIYFETL